LQPKLGHSAAPLERRFAPVIDIEGLPLRAIARKLREQIEELLLHAVSFLKAGNIVPSSPSARSTGQVEERPAHIGKGIGLVGHERPFRGRNAANHRENK
jgi:hypothetical protein